MKEIIKGTISKCKSCYCMTKNIEIPNLESESYGIICAKCGEYK